MEIWKDIKGYEGYYQVSSLGRVKSFKAKKAKIMKGTVSNKGYRVVSLCTDNIQYKNSVHVLAAIAFKGHIPCGHEKVINHIDFNKLNNQEDNLEIVTQRENCNQKHIKSSSQYIGVYWHEKHKKWYAVISYNGKTKYLGYSEIEKEASIYYENALLAIKNGKEIIAKKSDFSSKYKGVSWHKKSKKWRAVIKINKKAEYLGTFASEIDAHNAYQNALNKII